MANEFFAERVAVGSFSIPNAVTDATMSTPVEGVFIPKGAIVNQIYFYTPAALTNMSNMKNGTINPTVGGQVIGTNDRMASAVILQTALGSQAVAGNGVYVTAGGQLGVLFASSDSARTGLTGAGSIYVKYML
jgi:hypothetical protein